MELSWRLGALTEANLGSLGPLWGLPASVVPKMALFGPKFAFFLENGGFSQIRVYPIRTGLKMRYFYVPEHFDDSPPFLRFFEEKKDF